MLIAKAISSASRKLNEAGVTSPQIDAEWLASWALGASRSELTQSILNEQSFDDLALEKFQSAIELRAQRVPLQHITGKAYFRHLELNVGQGVFVPRFETEQVVGYAIELIGKIANPKIIDLCSGSGAIALSLFTEVEGAEVYAVEKSPEAFEFLLVNASSHGFPIDRLQLADLANGFEEQKGSFDLVICNPPYIPTDAIPVDIEVRLHEPKLALYGGEDGLDVIRILSQRAQELLKPSGLLVLEHADIQAAAISELLLADGWVSIDSQKDLAGKDRMISATKA
ncbi:MAG: peptide chain release factor N(5)-glutamine methyltransferase [Actinomycetota bacterium]